MNLAPPNLAPLNQPGNAGSASSVGKISVFDGVKDNAPKPSTTSLEDLHRRAPIVRDWVTNAKGGREKPTDMALWSPATFNGTRAKKNVVELSFLVFDVENITAEQWQRLGNQLQNGSFRCVMQTTFKHHPDAPRLRIIYEMTRAVLPDEYEALWHFLGTGLNRLAGVAALNCGVDLQTSDVSRLYFYPACPPDRREHYGSWLFGHAPLDSDQMLQQARSYRANDNAETGAGNNPSRLPTMASARVSWTERAHCPADADPGNWFRHLCENIAPPAVSGNHGQGALMSVANAGVIGLGLEPGEAADIAWEHYNPRCEPPWDDSEKAEFRRKFEQQDDNPLGLAPGYLLPAEAAEQLPDTRPVNLASVKNRTDVGMAEAAARRFAHSVRFCEARRSWLGWNGRQWELKNGKAIARRSIHRLVRDLLRETCALEDADEKKKAFKELIAYEAAPKINGVMTELQSLASMRVDVADLDSQPHLLNCLNGIVNLNDGKLYPHHPDLMLTKCTNVAYVPGVRSALWEQYLMTLVGGDVELAWYLQRAAGSSLWGESLEKAFFFLWGVPDSGKSRFLDALRAALGSYAAVASFDTWLQRAQAGGNRGDLVDLTGARVVVSSEVRPNAKLDSELIKAVTGDGAIKAAAKYEAEIEIRPTFTLWWAANDRPRVRADDLGFWNRARVIGCKNAVPKGQQIPQLAALWRQAEHAQAILAWLVQGCLVWRQQGLGTCSAVEEEVHAYRESQDPTSGFWEARVRQSQGVFVTRKELWHAWLGWAAAEGIDAKFVNQKDIYAKLEERFVVKAHKRNGVRGFIGVEVAQTG